MKIDIFNHIVPSKYGDAVNELSLSQPDYIARTPSLTDLDVRFRIMDKYDDYCQVLTIRSIEEMDIPASDKKEIYEDNARSLMRLPV